MNDKIINDLKKIYIKEDDDDIAFNQEIDIIKEFLIGFEKDVSLQYELVEPVGRGGNGIVFKVRNIPLKIYRALKFPRPLKLELIESVKSEIDNLNSLKHQNVINIYFLGEIKVKNYKNPLPYFIMDFIEGGTCLDEYVLKKLDEAHGFTELDLLTKWLANTLLDISRAINYIHLNSIIHFDIKPSNILIDQTGNPILTDLGFAKKKSDSNEPIIVGFTFYYAHPDLKIEDFKMSDKNRVRKKFTSRNFNEIWDIYSFGKTILEILSLIDQQYPDVLIYSYEYSYLHLASCRMLDGRNLSEDESDNRRRQLKSIGSNLYVFRETWLELRAKDFEEIKLQSFKYIVEDLEKLNNSNYYSRSIPELNINLDKRIQSSKGIPAPFTKRVRAIIEHPVFNRLRQVPQLGLLDTIYPSATHNRFEHSIGVFRNCCLFINSLFNDFFNPIFRQLVNEEDLKALLLASLIHDLGQYPFAHEIEENLIDLNHENITLKLLENKTKNKHGNTIKDIIIDEENGWGVSFELVKKILTGQKETNVLFKVQNVKIRMLSSIIDGPIDVDKVDYLIRDSQNCFLPYGELIDFERLIRNLTIIPHGGQNELVNFTVGTYEKGQSAAESLTFARYLLYQSLYWHHTSRSIRVMLNTAIKDCFSRIKKNEKKKFISEFEKIIGLHSDEIKPINSDRVLSLILNYTGESGKKLILSILNRNYYKRLATIHYEVDGGKGDSVDLNKFREVVKHPEFNEQLQEKIMENYVSFLEMTQSKRVSLLSPELTDRAIEILKQPNQILCDAPPPSFGSKKDNLRFIPEPHRLQRNYYSRKQAGHRVSDVWDQVHYNLMNIAAKGRIYCNPEIRDNILAALSPKNIKKIVKDLLESY